MTELQQLEEHVTHYTKGNVPLNCTIYVDCAVRGKPSAASSSSVHHLPQCQFMVQGCDHDRPGLPHRLHRPELVKCGGRAQLLSCFCQQICI